MNKLIVLLALVFALVPLGTLAQDTDPRRLTFEDAVAQSLSLRNVIRTLPDSSFAVIDDYEDLEMWTEEIVPFFGYEGITGPEWDETTESLLGGYIYPAKMGFVFFDDYGSQGHHHVLGRANCMSGELQMNARFANEVSSWHGSRSVLAVLVHELAHIQGICMSGKMSEVSAQLATVEVLSSMAIKGNDQAFGALLIELQGMYQDAALALALQEDRLDEFEYLFGLDGLTEGNAQDQAAWDKTMRYWAEDPEYLMKILTDYNLTPVLLIHRELPGENCRYSNVEWNKELQDVEWITHEIEGVDCINGVELPVNSTIFTVPLVIDDLSYVLDNYVELAAEIVEE